MERLRFADNPAHDTVELISSTLSEVPLCLTLFCRVVISLKTVIYGNPQLEDIKTLNKRLDSFYTHL